MKLKLFLAFTIVFIIPSIVSAKFYDLIDESGINFIHTNDMGGKYYMPEIFGSGAAFFDYDNDGDMDLYIVQSGYLTNLETKKKKLTDKLYRNDTKTADHPIFVDVTKQAKIQSLGYGMGVATGDLNNDGFVDIFVANYGANQIFMNNGNGTFTSSDATLPNSDKSWSVSAAIVDEDNDGFLDIYVVNYVDYKLLDFIKKCKAYDGSLDYCSPQGFDYQADDLYRNNKHGGFTNISNKVGLSQFEGPGLGVVSADFNNDGNLDFYVANDGVENNLWINTKNGEFVDKALKSGVAVNMNGEPEASMGVDAADFDNDGDVDLFMTHLQSQTNTLYVNNGKGWFSDLTVMMKLGSSSFSSTGFGTIWFDYDNDGLLDLFSANGGVSKIKEQIRKKSPFPYKQPNQLWRNTGNGKYLEVSDTQDKSFLRPSVSRGAAFGDFDNDGDIDIFVVNNNDVPQFLVNKADKKNNWIGFKVYDVKKKRTIHDVKITISQSNNSYTRVIKTNGSYSSSHDDRVVFGLGKNNEKVNVTLKLLNGKEFKYKDLSINKYHTIKI